ncbi:MAG: UDP-N-acetylglucosamine 1-carboxyvinyltransferase [Elusimicrobia bacterium]|nr:UDP-N-acetylglucosamine 1-carboxyvinyltransferase [Elusimicrobiota bacterium]
MDFFVIDGGRPLRGAVRISGSKNAALPNLISTLMTDDACTIHHVPELRDIRTTVRLLETMGKKVSYARGTAVVEHGSRLKTRAPYDLVKQMRASVLVAGPVLARFGKARVSLPGGCTIGMRPIDIHLEAFKKLGARVSTEHGDVVLDCERLEPGTVRFRFPSVGATENLMMAAAGVKGTTVLKNAAREPEIEDLGTFLTRMGARVDGAGTDTVTIEGTSRLHGAEHSVIADRVETGTFLLAALATKGDVRLIGAKAQHLTALLEAVKRSGATVTELPEGLRVKAKDRPKPVDIHTEPHPGFPTDLQAPWMAYMTLARGKSKVRESVFENRVMHAAELGRMGARIRTGGERAVVEGVPELFGAPIMASDIRAGAALVVAALAAKGQTVIQRVYHIDRGYEKLEKKLRALGAQIRRAH